MSFAIQELDRCGQEDKVPMVKIFEDGCHSTHDENMDSIEIKDEVKEEICESDDGDSESETMDSKEDCDWESESQDDPLSLDEDLDVKDDTEAASATRLDRHSSSGVYKCDQCSYTGRRQEALEIHLSTEHTAVKCYHCDVTLSTNALLRKHLMIKHAIGSYDCEFCNFTDYVLERVKMHMKVAHESKLRCDLCKFMLSSRKCLLAHRRSPHTHKCKLCPTYKFTPISLQWHKKKGHCEKNSSSYKCEQCDFTCRSDFNLNKHVTKMHGIKCKHCEHISFRKTDLNRHMYKNHNEVFTCAICGYIGKSEASLKNHLSMGHTHRCKLCPKLKFNLTTLSIHMLEAHANQLLKCDLCRFKTRDEDRWNKHQARVSTCPQCEFRACNDTDMHRHQTYGCLFQCWLCDHAALSQGALARHVKSVHIYKCLICPFTSTLEETLSNHFNSEHCAQEEQPKPESFKVKEKFQCVHCSKVMEKPYILAKHLKERHGLDSSYNQCEFCDFSAQAKSELKLHLKANHRNELKCPTCGFKASTFLGIKQHHLSGHKFKCAHCPTLNFSSTSLQLHKKEFHKVEKTGYKCELCAFITPNKTILETHVAKQVTCGKCDFWSCNKSDLCLHTAANHQEEKDLIMKHLKANKTKELTCLTCGFKATTISGIKNHHLSDFGSCNKSDVHLHTTTNHKEETAALISENDFSNPSANTSVPFAQEWEQDWEAFF
jgi:hypothetical protein